MLIQCLSSKSFQDIADECRAIPSNCHTLHLACESTDTRTAANFVEIFSVIPTSIHRLIFEYSGKIAEILPATPLSVNELSLELSERSTPEIVEIFASLPRSVTMLDLSNKLYGYTYGKFSRLIKICANTPENIEALDLSQNFLHMKTGIELEKLFVSISKNVTTINLCENKLHLLSIDDLVYLADSLPHIKMIYLSYDELLEMSEAKRLALKSIAPHLSNTILYALGSSLGINELDESIVMTNDIFQCANLARKMGLPAIKPLQYVPAFFEIKDHSDSIPKPEMPVTEELQSFCSIL